MDLEQYSNQIKEFCRKWLIDELAVFGSALTDDFHNDSDVDILVELSENSKWSLMDWVVMIEELKEIFGRDVDLVEKSGIRNPIRREAILGSMKVIYG